VGGPWVESVVGTAEDIKFLTRIFHKLLSRDREDGRATWQPFRVTAGLVPNRTSMVRRRGRDPRTPGRTAISVVAADDS